MIKYVNQCTMHICGMDFSSLASYWQIKALLMLEPSVVTPQNQYFPANSERMSVHCLESGCIGKYTHLGPRDFPRVGILHPSGLGVQNPRPWEISWASGSVFSNTSLLSAVYGYNMAMGHAISKIYIQIVLQLIKDIGKT